MIAHYKALRSDPHLPDYFIRGLIGFKRMFAGLSLHLQNHFRYESEQSCRWNGDNHKLEELERLHDSWPPTQTGNSL